MEIFLKAGFSIGLIVQRTPTKSLYLWRETYAKYGEAGLLEERRCIGSTGRLKNGIIRRRETETSRSSD